MLKPSTQFLRNIDYAPSNPQVLAQRIQAQNSKSLPALIALNSQNDQAAGANRHGLLQQRQQPTIAEREITEAMPQVAGIGANGMPNAEGISPMASRGVGALGEPPPQPIGSGVGQLPAPPIDPRVMAAGGGLISLAGGGQVIPFQDEGLVPYYEQENYVPISEKNMLQRWGGFLGGDDSDILGDLGYGARDALSDPTNYLMALPVVGSGLSRGAKLTRPFLKKAYEAAKKRGYTEKFADFVRSAWRNPRREWVDLDTKKGPAITKEALGKFSWPRAGTSASLGTAGLVYGGRGIEALMGDDAAPEGQRELMGPPKPSAALMEQNRRANELQEKLKAAQDAAEAGKGGEATPESKKGGVASLIGGLPLSAAMIVGGATYAQTGEAGTATEKGITTGLAVQKQELDQKKLKADESYREKSLELQKEQMKLVYDAAMAKTGLTKKDRLEAERKFRVDEKDSAQAQAMEELKEINKGWLGFGGKKTTQQEISKRVDEILDRKWMEKVIRGDAMSYLDRVIQEKASRAAP